MSFWKDYLREVFRAFWHALERTDTLVIVVFILSGIGSAALGRRTDHPSWKVAFAIFIVSLFGLLVRMPYRLYAEQRGTIESLKQKLTPKIHLSFHPEAGGVEKTPVTLAQGTSGSARQETMATYVRLRVEALSKTTVPGCKAFLKRLQKENADGKTVSEIPLTHSITLKSDQPFDVHPSVVHTIDFLICTAMDNKLMVPECVWPNPLRQVFDKMGTYRFTIMVSDGGIGDSITVAVGWPGQWDKIVARQV